MAGGNILSESHNTCTVKKDICFLLFSLFLFFSSGLFAGNENQPLGARAAGMSGTALCLEDVWAAQNNQSCLAFLKQGGATFHCENHFTLPELNTSALAFALPLNSGAWGFCLSRSGFSLYHADKCGLSYARRFGKRFAAAVQLDYLGVHIAEGYGSRQTVAGEISMNLRLGGGLRIGAHLFNPSRSLLSSSYDERIATVLRAGLFYACSQKVQIALETEKDNFNPGIFRAGFEYRPADVLFLRAGVSSGPAAFSFGAGIQLRQLRMDFASSWHPVLGYSPSLSLSVPLGSARKP